MTIEMSNNQSISIDSRQRLISALNHKQPDRVPIDLGGMDATGISGAAYNRLRQYIGLSSKHISIVHPYQGLSIVEKDILERYHVDIVPIAFEPKEWRSGKMLDGTPALFPAKWRPEKQPDSIEVVKDDQGKVVARRAESSWFFEPHDIPLANAECVADVDRFKRQRSIEDWSFFADEGWESITKRAKHLYYESDYALIGNFGGSIFANAQRLQGFDVFLINLLQKPAIAEAIMDMLVEEYIQRFDRYNAKLGDYIQVITVADDLGTQNAPQISPRLYKERVKPFHQRLYQHIHKNWKGRIMMHTDGVVYPLIPDLIECGVDILNPIQPSVPQMEPTVLKKEFGNELSFWGGGCDTQNVLPHGTPQDVIDDVRKRLEVLMPDGGYVFNQVHNILPDVPPQNIEVMLDAVYEYGWY